MAADITQRQSTEQGITNGMDQHIAIRVGDKALVERNFEVAEYQVITWTEGMDIKSRSYAHHNRPCCCKITVAKARSSRRVILMLVA